MDNSDLLTLLLTALLIVAAIALRARLYGDQNRIIGWWLGVLHGALAIVAIRAVTLAHHIVYLCAMVFLTIYALAMTGSEAKVLLRSKESS